ncbi:exported hypothetical protein [Paraburkholderia unamae]|uniref:hypothetical protein n=1 Tax=Paraburkholderia unamae TaxID=219649 RepID=UPI001CB591EA|nr:hypothetical protein [Paraburkholderia unamae]CAG9255261.1 exported hypothetical protein [Paraburkholderia unamae]
MWRTELLRRALPGALACLLAGTAQAYSLGEMQDDQGALAQARMKADIADSQARIRVADAQGQTAAVTKERPAVPSHDFSPYGYYRFGARVCLDVMYQDVLYTRCLGDHEPVSGWRLTGLTSHSATFSRGGESSVVDLGVAAAAAADLPKDGGTDKPAGGAR